MYQPLISDIMAEINFKELSKKVNQLKQKFDRVKQLDAELFHLMVEMEDNIDDILIILRDTSYCTDLNEKRYNKTSFFEALNDYMELLQGQQNNRKWWWLN